MFNPLFSSNYAYYDLKKENIERKYRKYKSNIFYSFGLLPYFILILLVPSWQVYFNYKLLDYSEGEMDKFATAAGRQL